MSSHINLACPPGMCYNRSLSLDSPEVRKLCVKVNL